MDCREVEDLIPAYALDALSPEEALEVGSHLEGCPFCGALLREQGSADLADLAEMRALIRRTHELHRFEPTPAARGGADWDAAERRLAEGRLGT